MDNQPGIKITCSGCFVLFIFAIALMAIFGMLGLIS